SNQPRGVKPGQQPTEKKNILRTKNKQCTLSPTSLVGRGWRQQGCCRSANSSHKEGSMAQSALRVVEGGGMDKNKALDAALSQIERAFGKGSIMRLGRGGKPIEIEAISTGSLGLDIALGIGGLPRGRVVEIYGPESSGKTTLALPCGARAPKRRGLRAFIDAEHALDPVYARKLGVNIDDLLISQPDTGEQALEICDTLVRSG